MNYDKLQEAIELLDDVINTLANYRSLQRKNSDRIGAEVTSKQINEIKDFIITNQVTTNYYANNEKYIG